MKFSIIVQIYNIENYLDKCILSVLNQNYKNFELILVNDGSTDGSYEICKNYERQDCRIIVVNKKNEGLPAARNSGIKVSTGDYICHLDGDDFWKGEYLEYLHEILKNNQVDVAFGGGRFDYFDDNNIKKKLYYRFPLKIKNVIDLQIYMMSLGHEIPASAWSNVYRRDFVISNNLYFTPGLTWSEDTDNYFNILMHVKSFLIMDRVFYCYRKSNSAAMTKSYNFKNIYSNIKVLRKWYKNYNISKLDFELKKISNIRFANTYIYISLFAAKADRIDKEKLCQEIEKDFDLMKHCKGLGYRMIYLSYKYLGINNSLKLINNIKKWEGD